MGRSLLLGRGIKRRSERVYWARDEGYFTSWIRRKREDGLWFRRK
jgi:hypothetical protein